MQSEKALRVVKAVSYKAHYWICVQVDLYSSVHSNQALLESIKVPQIRFDSSAVCFVVAKSTCIHSLRFITEENFI